MTLFRALVFVGVALGGVLAVPSSGANKLSKRQTSAPPATINHGPAQTVDIAKIERDLASAKSTRDCLNKLLPFKGKKIVQDPTIASDKVCSLEPKHLGTLGVRYFVGYCLGKVARKKHKMKICGQAEPMSRYLTAPESWTGHPSHNMCRKVAMNKIKRSPAAVGNCPD